MAIITFDPHELIEYMPELGDNRDSEEPCVVHLRFVPHAKVEKYRQLIRRKNKGTSNFAKMGEVNDKVQKQEFCESIDHIEGYRTNKGREITTPEDLYESAPAALIIELVKAMEDSQALDEGQAKNFKRVSDGGESEARSTVEAAQGKTEKTETVETEKGSQEEQEA